MGCGVYYQQVNTIDSALAALRGGGLGPGFGPFDILNRERAKLLGNIGIKFPRSTIPLLRLIGFSPGVIAIFLDVESGFMTEARPTPSSPPVYKFVGPGLAMKVLTHDISPELEEFLMTPDEDQDN